MKLKYLVIFLIAFALCTCIDPYTPQLNSYESLLVVDGIITNAATSNTIRLSRTFQVQNSNPVVVSDATVFLKDDKENISYLKNSGNGTYKTDSTEFRGIIGRTYVLHILTKENKEYESDPCLMLPVPDIDSVYIARDQKLASNETETQDGVSIFLTSKAGDHNQYYRWTYDETWKFKVNFPKKFDYIKTANPDNPIFAPIADIKEYCWKNRSSDEILIRSVSEGQSDKIEKLPIYFIATEKSDRLLLQYTILVKQYSISKNEYEFWNNLKQINETGSDIFARQPYSVISNIHNINNPGERVLGYFQVSAVSQKRKNIPYKDVGLMGLHFYSYSCKTWEFAPTDFDTPCMCPPKTWDDLISIMSDYTFTQPLYSFHTLLKLEFTKDECADCEINGSHKKPDFWDEIIW